MRKFISQNGDVSVFKVADEESAFRKDTVNPEAFLADVNSRVTNRNGDGAAEELTRRIAQVYRRVTAGQTGVHEMSLQERTEMRDRIVAAMLHEWDSPFPNDYSQPTEAIFNLASLLAGLTDDLKAPAEKHVTKAAQSADMAAIRASIAKLLTVVEGLGQRRAGGK
jgi:hypothetical protein